MDILSDKKVPNLEYSSDEWSLKLPFITSHASRTSYW